MVKSVSYMTSWDENGLNLLPGVLSKVEKG